MPSLSLETKNNKALSDEDVDTGLTWDGSDPLTWDEADRSWDALGRPITKDTKNNKSLSNEAEHI